jgi:hypothetical protein
MHRIRERFDRQGLMRTLGAVLEAVESGTASSGERVLSNPSGMKAFSISAVAPPKAQVVVRGVRLLDRRSLGEGG